VLLRGKIGFLEGEKETRGVWKEIFPKRCIGPMLLPQVQFSENFPPTPIIILSPLHIL
jgi:hypothetical protein